MKRGVDKSRVASVALVLIAAGAAFAGCSCDDESADDGNGGAGTGSSSSSIAVVSSSSTGLAVSSSSGGDTNLGAVCGQDSDCGGGLVCLLPSDSVILEGGPAGGYCTMTCGEDADCPGTGSTCLDSGDDSYCFRGCEWNPANEFDEDKCFGRFDVACRSFNSGDSYACVPTCGADQQCRERVCDSRTTVCQDAAHEGLPMASLCVQGDADECAGFCIKMNGATPDEALGFFCTRRCVQGAPLELNCGGYDDSTDPPLLRGYCAFAPNAELTGWGDLGFCAAGCLGHEDCQPPFLFCRAFQETGTDFSNGFCFNTQECANLDEKCLDENDMPGPLTCVDVDPGPAVLGKCIDLTYPFNAGTGGAAGAGGAGGAGGNGGMSAGGAGGTTSTAGTGGV